MQLQSLVEFARPGNDDRLRHAAEQVEDWSTFLNLASRHGMKPLVYKGLSRICPELVPPAILSELRAWYFSNALRNERFGEELIRVASAFESAGVEVIAFKGPVIAWGYYETPALREMSDLDLLVRPGDMQRAIDVLTSLGYGAVYPDRRLFRSGGEFPLVCASTGIAVDLHWSLAPDHFRYGLDIDGVWARKVQVQVAGRAVTTLGTVDLLIFLCVHGAKHGWCSLHWLADLARVIDRSEIDWDDVITQARARRVSRMVFAGLLLAEDLLGAKIPARLRADSGASRMASLLRQRLFADLPASAKKREELRYQLTLLERWPDKLRYLSSQLEPAPADRESLPLSGALFPVYYLFRPLRLLAKYSAMATRRISGDPG